MQIGVAVYRTVLLPFEKRTSTDSDDCIALLKQAARALVLTPVVLLNADPSRSGFPCDDGQSGIVFFDGTRFVSESVSPSRLARSSAEPCTTDTAS